MAVRLIFCGQKYGLDDCLTHDSRDPLVQFHDERYTGGKFGPHGQFISRYYASTLLRHHGAPPRGLILEGGVPEWNVDEAAMQRVVDYLQGVVDALPRLIVPAVQS